MDGIEAMFDAMQLVEGTHPGDPARQNRNPLNLRASAVEHVMTGNGYCRFNSIVDGTIAGLAELRAKVTGRNAHGITPESTLDQLYDVYAPRGDGANDPNAYAVSVAAYCSHATGRTLTHASTLREVCPEMFS